MCEPRCSATGPRARASAATLWLYVRWREPLQGASEASHIKRVSRSTIIVIKPKSEGANGSYPRSENANPAETGLACVAQVYFFDIELIAASASLLYKLDLADRVGVSRLSENNVALALTPDARAKACERHTAWRLVSAKGHRNGCEVTVRDRMMITPKRP